MANNNKKKQLNIFLVDPAKCRMWVHHNRNYRALDKRKCGSLMKSIFTEGEQKFPAIVRKLVNDAEYEYEVICGARRHWSITQLRKGGFKNFQYLIDVRELSDEEAFRISDIENRQRVDISHYERAKDYLSALKKYYKSQKEMANQLGVKEAWLSRYLDIARLPPDIIDCFQNKHEILPVHAKKLKKVMKVPDAEKGILKLAATIVKSKKNLSAVEVVEKLTAPYSNQILSTQTVEQAEGHDSMSVIKKDDLLTLRLDLVEGKLRRKDVNDAVALLNSHL